MQWFAKFGLNVIEQAANSCKISKEFVVRQLVMLRKNICSSEQFFSKIRPQSRRDYPLNLSILISGGKETNKDSLSNGERKGKSPALNLASHGC